MIPTLTSDNTTTNPTAKITTAVEAPTQVLAAETPDVDEWTAKPAASADESPTGVGSRTFSRPTVTSRAMT